MSTRQLLLQHALSPVVSLESTPSADLLIQQCCNNSLASVLQLIKPYGNNATHTLPNQTYKITNAQLITKIYSSFPIRFLPPLPELLSLAPSPEKPHNLFSVSNLDLLLSHRDDISATTDIYAQLFRMAVSSNHVVSFDTLNHPVAHVFVIDIHNDTVDLLRDRIVSFRNYNFPRYFALQDVLVHVFVLFDSTTVAQDDVAHFQITIKNSLSVSSTAFPVNHLSQADSPVPLFKWENTTVDEELQNLSLQQSQKPPSMGAHATENYLHVPSSLDLTLKSGLHDFVSRFLIPHMELKIRAWDDLILAPKKSITGRFFSVSRKLFSNASPDHSLTSSASANSSAAGSSSTFNYQQNYYYKSSPEQAIRKLADWSLMLNDFKYAYSTYDLIKKDYTNDKAWVYVASTQEMCIVSLLLAQTQPLSPDVKPLPPDRATLRKIRHDIIEPYMDNLSYTFKSRLNVRTYVIRAYLVVAELLLHMSLLFNIPWWWSDLIESYYQKCLTEIDSHLSPNPRRNCRTIRAVVLDRLGYAATKSCFVPADYKSMVDKLQNAVLHSTHHDKTHLGKTHHDIPETTEPGSEEDSFVNTLKMPVPKNNSTKGLTRYRKSSLWYLLSMEEWVNLHDATQASNTMEKISTIFDTEGLTASWYDREDLALGRMKRSLSNPPDTAQNTLTGNTVSGMEA